MVVIQQCMIVNQLDVHHFLEVGYKINHNKLSQCGKKCNKKRTNPAFIQGELFHLQTKNVLSLHSLNPVILWFRPSQTCSEMQVIFALGHVENVQFEFQSESIGLVSSPAGAKTLYLNASIFYMKHSELTIVFLMTNTFVFHSFVLIFFSFFTS